MQVEWSVLVRMCASGVGTVTTIYTSCTCSQNLKHCAILAHIQTNNIFTFYYTIYFVFDYYNMLSCYRKDFSAKYVSACSRNDPKLNECALREGLKAVPYVVKGDKEYKIPPLDPLKIPKILVEGPLTFTATDVEIRGLKDAMLKAVSLNLKNGHAVVKASCSWFEFLFQYVVEGKVLVLPITGKGNGNITLSETDMVYQTDFEMVKKKDNKEYIKFTTNKLDFDCKDMKIHLDNLFNGDKTLGDNMNLFLNENWKDVKKDLGPAIAEALAAILHDLLQNIANLVPYDEIFTP